MRVKCITILDEQEDFIKEQNSFNLSWFVRDKLKIYIEEMEVLKSQKEN